MTAQIMSANAPKAKQSNTALCLSMHSTMKAWRHRSAICFFDACKALLKKDGMLVINLWGGATSPCSACRPMAGTDFQLENPVSSGKDGGNIIGLAFNEGAPLHSMKDLRTRAIVLEQLYQIEFISFLKDIVKHNSSVINNLIQK